MNTPKVALVTGAARRLGAAIARELHGAGWNVLIHARNSTAEATVLTDQLNAQRPDSAQGLRGDLVHADQIEALAGLAHGRWGRLDALVNNASSYYPTPLGSISAQQFDDLMDSNLRAPLLLTQACSKLIGEGVVINIIDAQAQQAQSGYSAYKASKAGLWSLTQSLALELAPRIRVNGVAPGHMLWPEHAGFGEAQKQAALAQIPLKRLGGEREVARAVKFLLSDDAAYITGAVLPVDGGLSLG